MVHGSTAGYWPESYNSNSAWPVAKAFGEFAERILVDFALFMEEARRRAAEWAAQRMLWREPLALRKLISQDTGARAVPVTARRRNPGRPSWARRKHGSQLSRDRL